MKFTLLVSIIVTAFSIHACAEEKDSNQITGISIEQLPGKSIDLNADGVEDYVYFATVKDAKTIARSNIEVVSIWGKPLSSLQDIKGLLVLHGGSKDSVLLVDGLDNSYFETEISKSAKLQKRTEIEGIEFEPDLNALLTGDVITLYNEAGLEMHLYWIQNQYKLYEVIDIP